METVFAGDWKTLGNISADSLGSIHDAPAAQKLGFRGGFVPGSVVGSVALEGAMARFGPRFLHEGWYDLTFVSPVYEDDEVRAEADDDGSGLALSVKTRDGRLCCSGRAGDAAKIPWLEADDWTHGAEGVLPGVDRRTAIDEGAFSVLPADIEPLLNGAKMESEWYRELSPWGGPVAPPERLMRVALDYSRRLRMPFEGVKQPGMWAGHALVMREPVFLGRVYTINERVVDKGRSGRAVFLTYEFRIATVSGDEVATGRHKVKWLAE